MSYLARVKTDMELEWANGLHVNYHSRTLLPEFKKLPGGETTATIRLQGGQGNVQYPGKWIDYCKKVLNENDRTRYRYLFPPGGGSAGGGGIQNSPNEGRMEELTCEGNTIEIIAEQGNKCFVHTFYPTNTPPTTRNLSDPRIQRITTVNRLDQLTRATAKDVYWALMARPGEQLWIDRMYIEPLPPPVVKFPKIVTITAYFGVNVRTEPVVTNNPTNRIAALARTTPVEITETFTDARGDIWGKTYQGWIALRYGSQHYTDWKV